MGTRCYVPEPPSTCDECKKLQRRKRSPRVGPYSRSGRLTSGGLGVAREGGGGESVRAGDTFARHEYDCA